MKAWSFIAAATLAAASPCCAQPTVLPGAIAACAQQTLQIIQAAPSTPWSDAEIARVNKESGSLCPSPANAAGSRQGTNSGWYLADSNGRCVAAHAETPRWVVAFDRSRGLTDKVKRTHDPAGGQVVAEEVDTPVGPGYLNSYMFFRSAAACRRSQATRNRAGAPAARTGHAPGA